MALKARDQIKTVFGTGAFSLKADPGESLLVKAIKFYSPDTDWITLKTEKTTVGYFATKNTILDHLAWPTVKDTAAALVSPYTKNLLDLITDLGIFKGYPVQEGESFIITKNAPNAADILSIIYDIYDPEDQKNTAPNGSKALEYTLINYGDTGTDIAAAGDFLYNNCANPVEFPAFPFGADVPAKHQITIHGILGSEFAVINYASALALYSKYLKLIKDREVLFDEDRNGIPFSSHNSSGAPGNRIGAGYSPIGAFTPTNPKPPLIFAEPLVFDAGDELNIYVTTVEPVEGSQISQTYHRIGLIQTVKRITA